jgi:oligopeptide transport system ATP-binding protein
MTAIVPPPEQALASAGGGGPLVEVEDLRVYFPIKEGIIRERHVGDVRAVDDISFSLQRGETLGLVGESGCGKSTTGRAMLRLYEPTAGTVRFDGIDVTALKSDGLRKVRRRMQMIFQDPYASLNPRMTVNGIVGEPLDVHGEGGSKQERQERVREVLTTVGLDPEYGVRYPHEFSGGQRQRIGIARSLALSPEFIVADEPISALDVSIQAQIINLLQRLQDRLGLTYLFIAHDLSVVRHISDRIAVMYLGRIVEVAPSRELNTRPLHPYAVALLSAIPIPDPAVEARRQIILTGDVPSPSTRPRAALPHALLAARAPRQPRALHDRGPEATRRDRWARSGLPFRRVGRRFGRADAGGRRPDGASRRIVRPIARRHGGGAPGEHTSTPATGRTGAARRLTSPRLDSSRAAASHRPRPARAAARGAGGESGAPRGGPR